MYYVGGDETKKKWADARAATITGDWDSVDDAIYIQHFSNLKKIHNSVAPRLNNLPDVCGIWITGPTGSGKSHYVDVTYNTEEHPGALFLKAQDKWWTQWDQKLHKWAWIDDFALESKHLGKDLKLWADKYPFAADQKYAGTSIRPEMIIVTSNYRPTEIWTDRSVLLPILRRFEVFYKASKFEPPALVHKWNQERHDAAVAAELNHGADYAVGFHPPMPVMPPIQNIVIPEPVFENTLDEILNRLSQGSGSQTSNYGRL